MDRSPDGLRCPPRQVALERSRDDITYAANWLLERGYQELDRWAKDTIAVSKREQEEREMKVLLGTQQRGDNRVPIFLFFFFLF